MTRPTASDASPEPALAGCHPLPRPAVRGLAPRHHGGPVWSELARLGLRPEAIADFSVNVNLLGPSPRAVEAAAATRLDRYPDPEATDLRRTLAAHLGVPEDRLLVGNGSVELIWSLAATFIEPGERGLIVTPAFGEYEPALRAAGAEVLAWPADPHAGLVSDPAGVAGAIRRERPKLVYLCTPNNPSGQTWSAEGIARVHGAVREVGGLLVLDEAYLAFAAAPPATLDGVADGHLVVLRSLTKDLALAGLRLGYLVAHPDHVAALANARPPWSVNALALAAGSAALGDQEHAARSRDALQAARSYLLGGLTRLGFHPLPTDTNFCLVEVGDAARLRTELLARGVLVRNCASFGLPRHIRLAARPLPECDRLFAALAALQAARRSALAAPAVGEA